MYTTPPVTAFIVLSIVGMLIIGLAPVAVLSVYQKAEVTSPKADPVGDAKINSQNKAP